MSTIAPAPVLSSAQWSSFEREQIANRVTSIIDALREDDLPSPSKSKREFLEAAKKAKSFLKRNTSSKNFERWVRYLDVDELIEELNDQEAFKQDRAARSIGRLAVQLKYRLVGTAPGLELTVLGNLRQANENLINAIRFRDEERSIKGLSKQLESFAEDIREMHDVPTADDLSKINGTIVLLEQANQAPKLVSELRSRFRNPNIRVLVAERVVQSFVSRGVNESRPVRDCILGTRIVGTACLGGMVTANLLPQVGSVRLQVQMTGNFSSRNTGYNGPVKLRTVGRGHVNVSRTLHIDESGISADQPYAQATLDTDVIAIEHRLRLVRRIARKKVEETKPKADRIAVERLRSQVGKQFTEQTDEALAITPPNLMARVRPILKRLDLSEPQRLWGSTEQAIFVNATFASDNQLAAPGYSTQSVDAYQSSNAGGAIPNVRHGYDVAFQIHETVIDNAIAPILAGRTVTEADLQQLMPGLASQPSNSTNTGETSVSLDAEDDGGDKEASEEEAPFELEFARLRPIIFEARDQTLKLGIRGNRFTQGERTLRQALEITTNYRPAQLADGTAILIREGEVEVEFPGRKKKLSVSQTGLKASMQKKFSDVFPETLMHRALTVPSSVKMEALAGRSFRAQTIEADNGWVTITVLR